MHGNNTTKPKGGNFHPMFGWEPSGTVCELITYIFCKFKQQQQIKHKIAPKSENQSQKVISFTLLLSPVNEP